MIRDREMDYDRNEMISLEAAYNLKLNQVRSFVFSLFSESNQSESMLKKIDNYIKNDPVNGIRLKAEIEQFFQSMTYTDEKIQSILFNRERDGEKFYFNRYFDPSTLLNFNDIVHFTGNEYVKVYPYKNLLIFFLKVNDPLSVKISNVGTLVISVDIGFLEKKGNFLKEDSLIELKNEYGSLLIGDTKQFPEVAQGYIDSRLLDSNNYFITEVKNSIDSMGFTMLISQNNLKQSISAMRKNQWITLLIVILLNVFVAFYVSKRLSKRVKVLTRNMRMYQPDEYHRPIPILKDDEFTILEITFNQLTLKLSEYIQKEYVQEIKAKETELYLLQSQVNPHFLSNMLEILRMQAIKEGQPQIADTIYELSEIFRWNIRNKEMMVTLFEEIYYVELYLKLQKVRFPKMTFEIQLPNVLQNYRMVKFTIQPIIENIFKHALDKKKQVHIQIIAQEHNGNLHVKIQDDGKGISEEKLLDITRQCDIPLLESKALSSIGIFNVHARLRLIFGEEYGLQISSTLNEGTEVRLILPKT
ncbi:sensor histidine kinase [Paenibacillus germinis]|nr:histidine kinase [Paenibacillus germinis]